MKNRKLLLAILPAFALVGCKKQNVETFNKMREEAISNLFTQLTSVKLTNQYKDVSKLLAVDGYVSEHYEEEVYKIDNKNSVGYCYQKVESTSKSIFNELSSTVAELSERYLVFEPSSVEGYTELIGKSFHRPNLKVSFEEYQEMTIDSFESATVNKNEVLFGILFDYLDEYASETSLIYDNGIEKDGVVVSEAQPYFDDTYYDAEINDNLGTYMTQVTKLTFSTLGKKGPAVLSKIEGFQEEYLIETQEHTLRETPELLETYDWTVEFGYEDEKIDVREESDTSKVPTFALYRKADMALSDDYTSNDVTDAYKEVYNENIGSDRIYQVIGSLSPSSSYGYAISYKSEGSDVFFDWKKIEINDDAKLVELEGEPSLFTVETPSIFSFLIRCDSQTGVVKSVKLINMNLSYVPF